MICQFRINDVALSWNEINGAKTHWRYANTKKAYLPLVRAAVNRNGIEPIPEARYPLLFWLHCEFESYSKAYDARNLGATGKLIGDCLVDLGILEDDNAKRVVGVQDTVSYPATSAFSVFTIYEAREVLPSDVL